MMGYIIVELRQCLRIIILLSLPLWHLRGLTQAEATTAHEHGLWSITKNHHSSKNLRGQTLLYLRLLLLQQERQGRTLISSLMFLNQDKTFLHVSNRASQLVSCPVIPLCVHSKR